MIYLYRTRGKGEKSMAGMIKGYIKKQLTIEKLVKYAASAFLSVVMFFILPEVPFAAKFILKQAIKNTINF